MRIAEMQELPSDEYLAPRYGRRRRVAAAQILRPDAERSPDSAQFAAAPGASVECSMAFLAFLSLAYKGSGVACRLL
jgi:hypothetical protein